MTSDAEAEVHRADGESDENAGRRREENRRECHCEDGEFARSDVGCAESKPRWPTKAIETLRHRENRVGRSRRREQCIPGPRRPTAKR